MPTTFHHHHSNVRSHQLHLLRKRISQRLLPADRQNRHSQLRPRHWRKILRRLRERSEVCPSRSHPFRPRVRRHISHPVRLRQRPVPVRRQIIPEILEVRAFPFLHERFRSGPTKAEMPVIRTVVDRLPTLHTRQERIHHHQLLGFRGKLRRIRVSHH